jgi:hypothetical protein
VFIRVHLWLKLFLFGGSRTAFQNFAGLAVERFANGFERGKTDGLGLAGFEDGQVLRCDVHAVGQVVQPHFALREHHVQIDDDGHKLKRSIPVPPEFSGLRP